MAKFYSDLGGTKTTLDILSDALNIGNGIHEYNLNGALYTGNLPEPNYAYGNGTVFKRNKASITVVLYGGTQDPIATNYSSDGKTWSGWKVHALKSDLESLQIQSFTWRGDPTKYIDASIIIDGYEPIAIVGLDPTGLDGTSALRYFRFNKETKRAIVSFSANTVTACTFDVLCMRV